MSSDERSADESERVSAESEEREEANNSDEELSRDNSAKSEANESEKASDDEVEKKEPIKFDNLQLVLTNEVKIDVLSKNEIEEKKEIVQKSFHEENYQKKKNTYNLLSEVNNDLDQLFERLSKTIRTFNDKEKSKLESPKSIQGLEKNYINRGVQSPPEQRRFFSEKETNTSKHNPPRMKNEKYQPNRNDFISSNLNSKYSPKGSAPNYMRTVEDLYRNKNEPVIYSSSHRVNRKNYAGESEGFENREWKRENPYKPKDIIHAMDILLDKDD